MTNRKYDVVICGGGFAGTAAALTDVVTKLDVCKLQEILRKNGVIELPKLSLKIIRVLPFLITGLSILNKEAAPERKIS